jgi:hypothetical protein
LEVCEVCAVRGPVFSWQGPEDWREAQSTPVQVETIVQVKEAAQYRVTSRGQTPHSREGDIYAQL